MTVQVRKRQIFCLKVYQMEPDALSLHFVLVHISLLKQQKYASYYLITVCVPDYLITLELADYVFIEGNKSTVEINTKIQEIRVFTMKYTNG